MTADEQIVLVSSVSPGDPLHRALQELVVDLPSGAVTDLSLAGGSGSVTPTVVSMVARAAYVVVQEPSSQLKPEHVAAAVAARASDVPLLLVSPAGTAVPELMRLADVPPSRVVFYPTRLDDESAWKTFRTELLVWSRDLQSTYERARRRRYLEPITRRLSSAAEVLEQAAPTEQVAWAIARIYDAQTSSISLENHVDFLQVTFPANLYTRLLNQLTKTFRSVRTISDPVAEELPWDDPVDRKSLATVTERIFLVDQEHARQFGIEDVLTQVSAAARAGGGTVSVLGLTENLRAELERVSADSQRLKGLNRFYAGDNIVGGYADDAGEYVRLLAYHDSEHTAYMRETKVLDKVDELRRPLPFDRAMDVTALASWTYSNVVSEPRLESLYDYGSTAYADDYDGNIVRVTPGYYGQLDVLAAETKRALVGLYSPYSGRNQVASIRMLELGFGTGALTGRLLRISGQFFAEVRGDRDLAERPFVELDGWDSNPRMVEIASQRLIRSGRQAGDTPLQANLGRVEFDPTDSHVEEDKYDLVVGSFFSHYWADSLPDRPFSRAKDLQRLRGFMRAIRDDLLAPGGFALFLDAFYTTARRHDEEASWKQYVTDELGSAEVAGSYLSRNHWQFHAPSSDLVTDVVEELGFRCWWRDAQPGYPFKVLTLAAPPQTDQR